MYNSEDKATFAIDDPFTVEVKEEELVVEEEENLDPWALNFYR